MAGIEAGRNNLEKPFKACPWWVKISIRPDGLILAYCSYEEARKRNSANRGLDGPETGKDCLLGYTEEEARSMPSIIIYRPETEEHESVEVKNQLTDKQWGKIVQLFSAYSYPQKIQRAYQLVPLAFAIGESSRFKIAYLVAN